MGHPTWFLVIVINYQLNFLENWKKGFSLCMYYAIDMSGAERFSDLSLGHKKFGCFERVQASSLIIEFMLFKTLCGGMITWQNSSNSELLTWSESESMTILRWNREGLEWLIICWRNICINNMFLAFRIIRLHFDIDYEEIAIIHMVFTLPPDRGSRMRDIHLHNFGPSTRFP